ncbi:MAG TPA: DUF4276 family protein [Desulfobulbus sp.]|nr:DUF4276 family protein [Desulfobulbus sp.]
MKIIVFFLEEPSAREMLKGILPSILPETVDPRYIVFQGKQHMEKQLKKRIRGWCLPNTEFVVMRDQDFADCHDVKEKLVKLCRDAGRPDTLVRIACHELESFYLGDLAAVEKGLHVINLACKQNSAKFRDPDHLVSPDKELERITAKKYQKVSGSRAIGPHLQLNDNRSKSFMALITGIKQLVDID